MSRRREHVVVYDLGGGTFDVAVICMAGTRHDVLSCEGIARLGGDDFDEILLEMALAEGAMAPQVLEVPRARLLSLCREAKEAITANSRKVTLDFGQILPDLSAVMVAVASFSAQCQPLIDRTIEATESAMGAVLGAAEGDMPGLAAVYLVGGACELPLLARVLRERFGRRVRRSPYPPGATAIGLAIAADEGSGYVLQERFSRHFGVWREGEAGVMITFDPIFAKGTPLPKTGEPPLTARREYRPVHNVGRFRFLECSALGEACEPAGDVLSWDEAVFPFDPTLVGHPRLDRVRVERCPAVEDYTAEETYRCDAAGVIEVIITNLTTGYSKSYRVR
jgi:molecular chaperone DnaK (HSP70)